MRCVDHKGIATRQAVAGTLQTSYGSTFRIPAYVQDGLLLVQKIAALAHHLARSQTASSRELLQRAGNRRPGTARLSRLDCV
jgi:hypothetical protein